MPKPLPIVAIRNYRRLGLQCATLEEFADWMAFQYHGERGGHCQPPTIAFPADEQGAPRVPLSTWCAEADKAVCLDMLACGRCVNPEMRTEGRPRRETA